jgi:DHA1 family bicyclomycin/chloramphenicol resistance-like MFS transporter
MVAMSIDAMLPALGVMASELGAANDNDRQFILLGFFLGNMAGTLVYGPLSDSIGRKKAIYAGLVLYMVGGLACMAASTFPVLIAGRVLQGFGAAGPRIVSLAMVRDGARGAAMARINSFVMSVFMLVPILAPSFGQAILHVADWRTIFVLFLVMGAIAWAWLALRQEETLAPEKRKPIRLGVMLNSAGQFFASPVSVGYTLASGFIFGSFVCYLGTSQQVFAEQYQQGDRFALWFGGLAIAVALAMMTNARLVMRLGMRILSKWALRGFIILSVTMLLITWMTNGHPPLWVAGTYFFLNFFCSGMIFGNYSAMAMEPMGHVAGMAAAISGALSSLIAVVLGGFAGQLYDGTLFPIMAAFSAYGLLAMAATEWAERRRVATV